MDARLIVYLAWAVGSLLVWGLVFRDDIATVRKVGGRDRRRRSAVQELLSDFALLLVAIGSAISIGTLIVGQDIPGLRGFALAIALGGYLGAGIVKVTLRRTRD